MNAKSFFPVFILLAIAIITLTLSVNGVITGIASSFLIAGMVVLATAIGVYSSVKKKRTQPKA